MDLHGYLGILELGDTLVNQLFNGLTFEPARTTKTSKPEDAGDFRSISFGGQSVALLFGQVEVLFPTTPSSRLKMRIVMDQVAQDNGAGQPIVENMEVLAITIDNVPVSTANGQLAVELNHLAVEDLGLQYRLLRAGDWNDEDAFLDQKLGIGPNVPGARALLFGFLLAQVKLLKVNPTPLDVSALGGSHTDPVLFMSPDGRGSLQLRVYADAPGDATAGGPPLRATDEDYAIAVSESALLAQFADIVENMFPSQSATFSIVVPEMGAADAAFGPDTGQPVAGTISAPTPTLAKATLHFPADALTKHTTGKVVNWSTKQSHDWSVPHEHHAMDMQIEATPGDFVGVEIHRIGDDLVSYTRPTVTLDDKQGIAFAAPTTTYLGAIPVDGKVTFRVNLAPVPGRKFAVSASTSDVHTSGGIEKLGFLLNTMLFANISTANAIVWALNKTVVADKAKKQVGSFGDIVAAAFTFSPPPGLALFLDALSLSRAGMLIGGRAEGGLAIEADRTIPQYSLQAFATVAGPAVAWWTPPAKAAAVTVSTASPAQVTDAPFWSLTIGDAPSFAAIKPTDFAFTMPAHAATTAWIDAQSTVKVMFDLSSTKSPKSPQPQPTLTWVSYPKRLVPSVVLVPSIVVSSSHAAAPGGATYTTSTYAITVALDLTRIFLTPGTFARGQERWMLNGAPVAAPETRTLTIDVPGSDAAQLQLVEVTLTDVFGRSASAKLAIPTPTLSITSGHRGFDYKHWFGGDFQSHQLRVRTLDGRQRSSDPR